MEIRYKDFAQKVSKGEGFFAGYSYSILDEVIAEASSWVKDGHINVLNIETLLLPSRNRLIQSSESPMSDGGEDSCYWFQVVRVWFKATT